MEDVDLNHIESYKKRYPNITVVTPGLSFEAVYFQMLWSLLKVPLALLTRPLVSSWVAVATAL